MIFLKVIHMYQFLGALASCYFSYTHIGETILPLCFSIAYTVFLTILFFIRTHRRLFYSMIIIHVLQLVSLKTLSFGYLASIGVGLYIQFNMDHFSVFQFLATLAIFNFSPTGGVEPQAWGINIIVLVTLMFLSVSGEMKYKRYPKGRLFY